jgi:hypothetical protein
MKIASNRAMPNSSVARAEAHCTPFRPCAVPLFVSSMVPVTAWSERVTTLPVCLQYACPTRAGGPRTQRDPADRRLGSRVKDGHR